MENDKSGGQAFPLSCQYHGVMNEGMTLRQHYVGQAIASLSVDSLNCYARITSSEEERKKEIAFQRAELIKNLVQWAFDMADAAIAFEKEGG